jgi:hypothetical protein
LLLVVAAVVVVVVVVVAVVVSAGQGISLLYHSHTTPCTKFDLLLLLSA